MAFFRRIFPLLFFIFVEYVQIGFVYPVVAAIFVHATPFDYPNFFPQITTSFGLKFFMVASSIIFPLATMVGAPLFSTLSDKYGRRPLLTIASIGTFVGVIAINNGVLLQSIFLFFIGRALAGFMASSQPLASATIADLSEGRNKLLGFSLVTLTIGLAIALGPFILNYLTARDLGFHFGLIPIHIYMALITLFLMIFFFQETKTTPRVNNNLIKISKDVKVLLIPALFLFVSFTLYLHTILIYLRMYFFYSQLKMGFFYGFFGLLFIPGIILLYYLCRKTTPTKLVAWGMFFTGLFMLPGLFFKSEIGTWLLAVPIASAFAIAFTALQTLFSDHSPKEYQGQTFALFSFLFAFSYIVSGLLTIFIPFNNPMGLIFIGGLIALFGSVPLFQKKEVL